MSRTGENQYMDLCSRIVSEGTLIRNERTGKECLTVINADFEYDTSSGRVPILTTRRVPWRSAVAEMLGYLRGYSSADQFAAIGCKTWFANANETEAWLRNPHRKGRDDIGRAYGVQLRNWRNPEGNRVDQLANVIHAIEQGTDNRRMIMTFHNPGELDRAALDSCMHTHHFSLVGNTLHLTSYQRSVDVPLGLAFNMVQTVFLLRFMAQITNYLPGTVYHKMVNCHIYADQLGGMQEQRTRTPREEPALWINPSFDSLRKFEEVFDPRSKHHVSVQGYDPHESIHYPFSA